jgi:hypothetical protein
MKHTISIFLILLGITFNGLCQIKKSFQPEIDFTFHLLHIKAYDEAIMHLNDIQSSFTIKTQVDTINFLIGKAHYLNKNMASSIASFNLVSDQTERLQIHAQFYTAFGYGYTKKYDMALNKIQSIQPIDSLLRQLRYTQLAGSYLLANQLNEFQSTSKHFNQKHIQLQRTNNRLQDYALELQSFKKKSPVVAGILSAMLPGSGKVYAGKIGEGVSSLLQHLIFGLMLRESYNKFGPNSVQFGIFGTIFSTLYISNIWSSTFSVKIYRNEFNESLHESIMLDLHIPLRSILN